MKKIMRIALTGAGGTGKGTLIAAFHKLHPEYMAVTSPMKPIASILPFQGKNYADYDWEKKNLMQYACLCAEINTERAMSENALPFIAERSVFDFLPYYADACNNAEEYKGYESVAWNHAKGLPYDILAYIPIEFEPHDLAENAWKERDSEKRKETDGFIQSMLGRVARETETCIITVKGTPKERAAQLAEAIRWREKEG